jgi:nucleoid DNA-binding protein
MAKKATPTTVTLKHLAAAIAEEQELSKKQAEAILNDLVGRITKLPSAQPRSSRKPSDRTRFPIFDFASFRRGIRGPRSDACSVT